MSEITLFGYYDNFLTNFYLYHTFPIMTIIFSIFIFLLLINSKEIFKGFSKIKKKYWIFLLIIFIFGFWLRNAEYIYGTHTDAFEYAISARHLVEDGIFVRDCSIGNTNNCKLYEQVLYTQGYPYLISLLYIFFGTNTILGSILSAVLSSLTIVLIFLISSLLFKNEYIGLYSSLIFSLIPLDLYFANTGNLRPTSLFFISLTTLFYLIALKKDTIKMWSLVAITFSFSIIIAKENAILSLAMLFGLFLFKYYKKIDFKDYKKTKQTLILSIKKFTIPIIILLITQIPTQYWVISFENNINSGKKIFGVDYFKIMAPTILKTLFPQKEFNTYNPIITLIFFTSIIHILFKNKFKSQLIFLWSIFILYFFIYSSYFQCQGFPETICAEYVRMIQHFHLPYSILAAYLLINLKFIKKDYLLALLFIFLLVTTPITIPKTIFKDSRIEKPVSQEKYFKAVNSTQNNCTIITSVYLIPTTDVFVNNTRKTINLHIISPNFSPNIEELSIEQILESSCTYYFDDGFCFNKKGYPCKFIDEKLNLEYLYEIDGIKIYNVTSLRQ